MITVMAHLLLSAAAAACEQQCNGRQGEQQVINQDVGRSDYYELGVGNQAVDGEEQTKTV
jgi:hypothetical protein